ncbi:MAG: NUDIX hydrolase [Parcubacteria group bacterium GW2011_GWA2_46_7]|nr:MAG: NUDIX hydrolase [Parcubacteria group bacterium GW2011_GWA2_46_7]
MSADEPVDIVDEKDEVVGTTFKHQAHREGLLHRTVIAEVIGTDGKWTLIKQASDRQDAGQFVSPIGGHVAAGELEKDALKREANEEYGLDGDISFKLIGKKIFSREVIEIFRRLGEDFKPASGALALSQDLSYLDNLVVKREDELSPQEKTTLIEYTSHIRERVVKLETIYGQIKSKFGSLKQGTSASGNTLLQDKLTEIDKIINTQASMQAVTSTVTNNLNVVNENIRECLSCVREGCNNDTNLTFGDMNKFYLYSQTEGQERGSISDELLFVEPIIQSDGNQGIAFVMDKIYGTNTPVTLGNQVEAVLKKFRILKQRFPEAKLSVFVTNSATAGCMSPEMLVESLKQQGTTAKQESIEVNVVESPAGDHYIEFGGAARAAGKRQVDGVIIS